jgi:alkylation response protein AidB-like acyl-CoA dehydrogenase
MSDTGDDAALLEVARAFRPRIIAERDRIETARRLPQDLTRDLARAGFSASSCPKPMAASI